MKAEQQAVNTISEIIMACPHLMPRIDMNDRAPLTDGHIDIHSSSPHTNKNFLGRVSVQVKGKTAKGAKLTSYPIRRVELEAFSRTSGVLYFVVAMDPGSNTRTAFYALLNPFRINRILKTMKPRQKQVSVKLKRLPTQNPEKVESLVKLALITQKESLDTGWDATLMTSVKELTIHTDREWDLTAPIDFPGTEMDYSVVIKTFDGLSLPADIEFSLIPETYIGERMNWVVSSGPFAFEKPLRRRVDRNTVEIVLSEGLTLRLQIDSKGVSGSVEFRFIDDLLERHKIIGFLLNMVDEGSYSIDDRVYRHEPPQDAR